MKRWNTLRQFCSISCAKKGNKNRLGISYPAWNKGKKLHYQVWNKGNGEYAKALGFGTWMRGKKASEESRRKNSVTMKRLVSEGKHNFYIDGRTPQNKSIRHSVEYKLWRSSVFERDNYTCQECGAHGVILNADHIKPFAYFPESRFELSNGRTLYVSCHAQTPTYKGRALSYIK